MSASSDSNEKVPLSAKLLRSATTTTWTAENGLNYSPLRFGLLFIGLALVVFLAALDQTIVAVAIPSIVTDFQTFSGLSWIGTAYFLASTPLIPTWGKLADIFGRRPVFIGGIVLFEAGSLICGLARSMPVLIIGRAISGLGAGGMFPMVVIIISDVVALRDRPKYQGIIGAVIGVASVAGPLMGGVFTDKLSWRWCFFINLPFGALTIVIAILFLNLPSPKGNLRDKLSQIDALGTFWMAAATVLLVYSLSAGGGDFSWGSPLIISILVLAVICAIVFAVVEARYVQHPLISKELWGNRYVVAVWMSSFFLGMTFFSLTYYIPIYFQVVNGNTATEAGVHTIPFILSLGLVGVFTGIAISATGYTAPFVSAGAGVLMVGAGLISTMSATSGPGMQIGYLVVAGFGVGLNVQTINLNGQGVVEPHLLAVMISSFTFFQVLGAVFGIAINGTILSNSLTYKLESVLPSATLIDFVKNNPSKIRAAVASGSIPVVLLDPITTAYTDSLSLIFKTTVATAGALFLASFLLKRNRLQKKVEGETDVMVPDA
ncbi:MFS general substrate transporter [Gonapodya prolifera JEL478]|uniref:MFS general substrate transporter n=1 Tax=Gonapodya prolifera (strain JEL478) TaxID=1344416 RepID=A0A138ZZU2_GONPJ|nr:MFS general substrate transporter [Gonapodya prolifera JEL478]|eukprot:KXS09795.1 MFS general substrate transporter [Gonapodya prolifera JEL478]